MITIHIQEPIWSRKAVGIAHHRIVDDLEVLIDYRNKYGNKVYPGVYRISQDKATKYPVNILRKGKKRIYLHIIPINAMEIANN